ncbi:hypothetical protein AN963_09955 [Brevibacillus choshinensis]|uniref:PucR family transcriptional regulator n=1 Tax=Brevibacillus choshinensis TaxID=54911 RepID=A0ABR5NEN9_BRECH|nr:PucR family transcriptional regulator [Brevibacillus choshinensis]KQL49977.1 hypothetical protein AN963_09955 [Brevibacillus choshinensis]
MGLAIREILLMKEMEHATLLAGSLGIDRIVQSTTVLDAPDAIKWLKGNELALTSTYPLLQSPEQLDHLVEELVNRNVAGLGVKLNRYIKKIPETMLQTANEMGFPIISLPSEKAWIEFINPILTEILNHRAKHLLHSEEIHQSFTRILLANSDMEELAELIHFYARDPIGIFMLDEKKAIVIPAHFPLPQTDLQQMFNLSTHSKTLIDPVHEVYSIRLADRDAVLLPVHNAVELVGHIVIFRNNMQLAPQEINLCLHAKNAVALKIMQLHAEQESRRRYLNEFVTHLLYHPLTSETLPEVNRKGWELGIELSPKYIVLSIKLESLSLKEVQEMYDVLSLRLEPAHHYLLGIDKENHIVCLYPSDMLDKGFHDNTAETFISLLRGLESFNTRLNWAIGISQKTDLYSLPDGYRESLKALYHGIRVSGYKSVQLYQEMGIYRLLTHPALMEEALHYVREILDPLLNYDRANQANLVNTLKVFLDQEGNYRDTAKELFVHHNTVRYRVQLIERQTGRDLQIQSNRLQFQVALLLLPLVKNRKEQ